MSSLFVCLFIFLSVCLSVCLFICFFAWLSILASFSLQLMVCLFVFPFVCLFFHLSVYISVCQFFFAEKLEENNNCSKMIPFLLCPALSFKQEWVNNEWGWDIIFSSRNEYLQKKEGQRWFSNLWLKQMREKLESLNCAIFFFTIFRCKMASCCRLSIFVNLQFKSPPFVYRIVRFSTGNFKSLLF